MAIDRQLRYGTGIQYEIKRDITAGAAWEFMDAGLAPHSARHGPIAGTLQGHYSTNYLNCVALNLIWKFQVKDSRGRPENFRTPTARAGTDLRY
jgi:long-chain fatty acid transport protein